MTETDCLLSFQKDWTDICLKLLALLCACQGAVAVEGEAMLWRPAPPRARVPYLPTQDDSFPETATAAGALPLRLLQLFVFWPTSKRMITFYAVDLEQTQPSYVWTSSDISPRI